MSIQKSMLNARARRLAKEDRNAPPKPGDFFITCEHNPNQIAGTTGDVDFSNLYWVKVKIPMKGDTGKIVPVRWYVLCKECKDTKGIGYLMKRLAPGNPPVWIGELNEVPEGFKREGLD